MRPYLRIEPVTVHAEVARRIAKTNEAGRPLRPCLIVPGWAGGFKSQRSRPVSWTGAARRFQIRKWNGCARPNRVNEWFIPCTGRGHLLGRRGAKILRSLALSKLTGLSGSSSGDRRSLCAGEWMTSRLLRTGNRPTGPSDPPSRRRIDGLFLLRFACYLEPARLCPESAPSLPRIWPESAPSLARVAVGAVMSVRPAERRSERPNAATVLIEQ